MIARIAWSEGMFIAPQHFQHADKAVRSYADALAQLDVRGGDFGVNTLELNLELLPVGKLAVRTASGVFPDRLYFELSKELVLDIPEGVVNETVYLAVPLAIFGAAEFGGTQGHARFLSSRKDLRDLRDDDNEQVETEVAEAGVSLKLGSDDRSGYATIPIANIQEKAPDGRIVLDPAYIPRAISIAASPLLCERLEEMISLARVRANNAAGRVATGVDARSELGLLNERLELQVLNRWLFTLQNIAATNTVSPRALFGALGCLLSELEALSASSVNAGLIYDPIQMSRCFNELFAQLRQKLTLEKPASVLTFNWNSELFETRRLLRLIIPASTLAKNLRLVLALSSEEGMSHLHEVGPLSCKLAGLSSMPELVTHDLPGIDLIPLATAPAELRSRSNAAYFSINTKNTLWQKFLKKHEALALHVDDRIPLVDATLYMLD
ncbi:type VI secretion system baseplate subunit TssK [Flexibacterium corallicola]|uniref:type VI secretion system baseplate subunit TssK n=1 Tax=Flexibacterium corallicola TaxID=3037259 RepID=UPI00286F03AD|nr:type VI secretion system baseplate subunit TssK [Pseudovibrio sp. M1P-2-3]